MKVNVKNITKEYQGFFTLEKARLQFEKFDGSASEEVVRENFYRGDSVAALIYDKKNKLVLLVRQFRYPVYTVEPDEPWIVELVAGSCNEHEDPAETLLREMVEEVHIRVTKKKLKPLYTFFVSPGGTSERIHLYAVETDLSNLKFDKGGLKEEEEDIEIILLPINKVLRFIKMGRIKDAKSIIALQWLQQKMDSFDS